MSEPATTPGATPPAAKRRLPVWAGIVIGVLVAVIVVLLAVRAAAPGASTDPIPTGSATPSPTVTPTETLSSTPTPEPTETAALDDDLIETFLAALNSGNTAVFVQSGYFNDPILVVGAASGINEQMSAVDAVNVLNPMLSLELPEPWQSASDADIATYRSGSYAQYFPDGAIVVNSTEGHVIVFIGAGRDVETLFFAMVEDSLLP